MQYFYVIMLILFMLIYKKTFLILLYVFLNFNYLSFLYNFELDSNIRNYIIFSILFTIFVYGNNAILPLFILYMYLLLIYLIYTIKMYI
jgi:hypothetical protein